MTLPPLELSRWPPRPGGITIVPDRPPLVFRPPPMLGPPKLVPPNPNMLPRPPPPLTPGPPPDLEVPPPLAEGLELDPPNPKILPRPRPPLTPDPDVVFELPRSLSVPPPPGRLLGTSFASHNPFGILLSFLIGDFFVAFLFSFPLPNISLISLPAGFGGGLSSFFFPFFWP